MKRKDQLTEIRGMSAADLKARAKSLSEELMKLRFRKASGQLEHGHRMGQLKRDLARVRTVINVLHKSQAAK